MPRFRPCYVFEDELEDYGLPPTTEYPRIMTLVRGASTLIDEHCGRTDGNGNGTLAYCTYVERLLLQARGRNILRVSFKPMALITPSVAQELASSGAQGSFNYYDTKAIPNTIRRPDGSVSCLLGASGRYAYGRRGEQAIYPDLNYGMNILQVASYFGGPPSWVVIDISQVDYAPDFGEIWVPAGLYMSQYTELAVAYNSGYDPRDMPPAIKDACAAIVRNYIAKGGTTGTRGLSSPGAVSVQMNDKLIDDTVQDWLEPFMNVGAM